jgi:NAD-dependent SIR2 family protein deacetylase
MEKKILNPDLHKALIDGVVTGKLIVFAGAGLSINAGLPSWKELVETIALRVVQQHQEHEGIIRTILNSTLENKLFSTLNYLETNGFRDDAIRIVYNVITESIAGIEQVDQDLLHSKVWQITKKIVTTNYDNLFEIAAAQQRRSIQALTNESSLEYGNILRNDEYLIKIHGSVNSANSIIFFESDYKKLYDKEHPAIATLESLVAFFPILILGASMTDPYINRVIEKIGRIYRNGNPGVFFLTNDLPDKSPLIKIEGDPLQDTQQLLDELIVYVNPTSSCATLIEPLNYYISQLSEKKNFFPDAADFYNGQIHLNESLFRYLATRFENAEGPVLIQDKVGSGKTVMALRVAVALEELGYKILYEDLAQEYFRADKDCKKFWDETLKKFVHSKTMVLIDNADKFPEVIYQIAQWAFHEGHNIVFIGRPISQELHENNYYYPKLFKSRNFEPIEDELVSDEDEQEFDYEDDYLEINSPLIQITAEEEFKQETFLQIFRYHISKRMLDIVVDELKLMKLEKRIGSNFTFLIQHVKTFKSNKANNIYFINYSTLKDDLAKAFKFLTYHEVFTIAAVQYIGCRAQASVVFNWDSTKLAEFMSAQKYVNREDDYLAGINPAIARLVLEIAVEKRLIFGPKRNAYVKFHLAFRHLIMNYCMKRPSRIVDIFQGLVNLKQEAKESKEIKLMEDVGDLIVSLLTNKHLCQYYRNEIIPSNRSFRRIAFFIALYGQYKIGDTIINIVFSPDSVSQMAGAYLEYIISNFGENAYIQWKFIEVWRALLKLGPNVAEPLLEPVPDSLILNHAQYSLAGLQAVIYMGLFHKRIANLVMSHRITSLLNGNNSFSDKFTQVGIVRFLFLVIFMKKFEDLYSEKLVAGLCQYVSPQLFRDRFFSNTRHFRFAYKAAFFLGREYQTELIKGLSDEEIYDIYYQDALPLIAYPFNHKLWNRFLKKDLAVRFQTSPLKDIQLFLRNVLLHGFAEGYRDVLHERILEHDIAQILIDKVIEFAAYKDAVEDIYHFFNNLNSMNIATFNHFLTQFTDSYVYRPADNTEYDSEYVARFLLLLHFYSEETAAKTFISQAEFDNLKRRIRFGGNLNSEIWLAEVAHIFSLKYDAPSWDLSKIEQIAVALFSNNDFQWSSNLEAGKNEDLTVRWEFNILTTAVLIIAMNKIDSYCIRTERISAFLIDTRNSIEQVMAEINARIGQNLKVRMQYPWEINKLSILQQALDILNSPIGASSFPQTMDDY